MESAGATWIQDRRNPVEAGRRGLRVPLFQVLDPLFVSLGYSSQCADVVGILVDRRYYIVDAQTHEFNRMSQSFVAFRQPFNSFVDRHTVSVPSVAANLSGTHIQDGRNPVEAGGGGFG